MPYLRPVNPTGIVRLFRRWEDATTRHRWATAALLHPFVARPGYWIATGLPRWAFGRGGTTIGAVYLTRDNDDDSVLAHEAVHRAQWRKFGLAFIPLYIAAGVDARTNRFEVEAGLESGGYRRHIPR